MNKFEIQSEERERRKRQRKREWHLFMDEISLLQDKLNSLKQRQGNIYDSIEEQLHFIQVYRILNLIRQYQRLSFRINVKN